MTEENHAVLPLRSASAPDGFQLPAKPVAAQSSRIEIAETVGVELYLFEHDARPGVQVARKLQTAIRRSNAMIVLHD